MSAADATELSAAGAAAAGGAEDSPGSPLTTSDPAAETTRFTGQIVHNRDGSLVVVDADVRWVSEPDSIVDDGNGRMPSGAVPPAIRSVLFIRSRREARADRTEAGVPPGLIVDRYRVCDADGGGGGGGGSGADVACEADGTPDVSSSAPGRTNITCCVCRLCFGAAPAFAAHCVSAHGLPLDGAPLLFLARPDAAAVLATAGADRRPTVTLLRFNPCPSDRVTDGGTASRGVTESERGLSNQSGEDGARARHQGAPSDGTGVSGSLESSSTSRHALPSPLTRSSPATGTASVTVSEAAPSQLDIARSLTVTSQAAAVSVAASSTLKTLKCPRCNWHFKYRDTLEVHLREKHPEGGSVCGFCLSGQPHPRLSRGEAHDCGYKPYRCDVCHYATTTKGNLSIHMQSDKHLNNVQERQRALRGLCVPGERIGKDGDANASVEGPAGGSAQGDRNSGLRDVVQVKLKVLSDAAARPPQSEGGTTLGDKIAMWFAKQPDLSKQDDKCKGAMKLGELPESDQANSSQRLNPRYTFTCCTCTAFSTDSLEELEQHMRRDRGSARNGDFTAVEDGVQVCLLCSYRTHLRANFLLHCQSDKHVQKLHHLLHILEGGAGNLWQLPYLHATSPVAVRCNLCEVSAGMGVQLRVHSAEGRHQACRALWMHLREAGQAIPVSRRRYGCTLCGYSARHVLLLLRHTASLMHLGRERRHQVERQAGHVGAAKTDDSFHFSVRDAGPNADNDPDEMFESTEDNSKMREVDESELKTNGYAGSATGVVNADVVRSQLNPGVSDEQSPTMCNGLSKHKTDPNVSSGVRRESNRCSEKEPHGVVGSGEDLRTVRHASKCDLVAPGIHAAKAGHDENPKLEDTEGLADRGAADPIDNISTGEDSSRPYKCHACNVSYGHPQILTIHLQSASHQARASAESQRSLKIDTQSQLRSVRGSESISGKGASQMDVIDKGRVDILWTGLNNDNLIHSPVDALKGKMEEVTIVAVKKTRDEHHRSAKLDEKATDDEHHAQKSGLRIMENQALRTKHVINVGRPSPTGREPQSIKDQLLESYGLELAMHHCESRRKGQKLDNETQTNNAEEKMAANNLTSRASSAEDYVCPLCQKCFSGLWIFKLHVEEIHHKYVPGELLEVHIEALSKELHERRKAKLQTEKRNADCRLNETTKSSRSEWHPSGEQASPAPSSTSTDNKVKTSLNPEKSRVSPPPSAPQLPVPDIQTALSLIQAAHIRYQMQQLNPLLASQMAALGSPLAAFGLGETSAQSQQLLSLLAAQQFLNPSVLWAAQAQALAQHQHQQSHAPLSASSKSAEGKRPADSPAGGGREEKRARTRISGYQLKILRAHFDMDRTPSDEAMDELGKQCGLPPKVVKHWFRNTLFKERQKDKDSPYNFSVPPGAPLELSQQGRPELIALQSDELSRGSPLRSVGDDSVGSESKSERDETREARRPSPEATTSESAVAVDLSSRTPSLPHHTSLMSGRGHGSSPLSSSTPPPAHNGGRPSGVGLVNALPAGFGWGAPVTREFGELSITLPSRSPFQQSPSPGGSSSIAYGSPMWSEISPPEGQKGGGRRANRTRFTDQQVKVLQDFFEKNAYPKEEDLRHLSKVLNLGPRVIVVWFQNARQKVRKVFENQPPSSEREEDKSGRFQRTAELNYQCNRCKTVYQRYQELVRHQRQLCYREESSRQRGKSQEPRSEAPAVSIAEVKPTPQDNTYKCGKCPQEFDRFDRWREHQVVHVMNPSVVPSSRQNQFSGSATGPPSARPSHSAEEASDEETDDAAVWDRHAQDRRLRTSINPEQLEVLQRTYKLNSTPSRETLEAIARGTGLKKRVVQVWFQNARARERKSQAVRQMQAPVTYSGPTETVVKTKVTEPKLGPEVSVELVKTYSKVMPSALVPRQREDHDTSSPMPGFTALRHSVLEARLQAPPPQTADAPLDLSKSHTSMPPATSSLTNASKAAAGVAPPSVRRDMRQLTVLPLLTSREDIPWSSRPAADLASAPAAPSSTPSGAASARSPYSVTNKRFRTQMSPGQVSVLRSVFAAYRMPTMAECARLGAEIGLAKRVVQVWFQNSRAKEKKRQLQSGRPPTPPPQGCDLCRVGYGVKCSLQEHLLSRAHIERVQRESERSRAAPPASGSSAQATSSSGTAGAATSPATAPPPPPRGSVSAASSTARPGLPPPPPTRESADDGKKAASRSMASSPPQEPPAVGSALRSSLLSKDGAGGPPLTRIGDATCDPSSRPPTVSAGAVPMATSVG